MIASSSESSVSWNPLVSVIVPVYNGAEFVGAALESALRQTYRNIEIIVVDDGSSDGTLAILETFSRTDSRVKVVTQANGGVARARNQAIREAAGEFIAPLDADDLWEPTKIERQVLRMLEAGEKTGLVYCWWVWIDCDSAVLDRSPGWRVEGNALEDLLQINFTGNASVPLLRKSCVIEAGGYNEGLAAAAAGGCEDWELALRIAARHAIAVVPEMLVGYRRRPGSMSTACQTMWRSQELVVARIRQLRPDVPRSVFRSSANQFAMYLAGLSFWAGNLGDAMRWAFRSGCFLPIHVGPYVARVFLRRNRKQANPQAMVPGVPLEVGNIPEPLIPYDRIYRSRFLTSSSS